MKKILLLLVLATPAFAQEPDWETKKDALMRAYHQNGDRMCCGFVDLTDAPAHASVEVADPTERNALDAQADDTPGIATASPDWEARRRFMNRTFRATRQQIAGDICTRHGMHKVVYGDKWRCRK